MDFTKSLTKDPTIREKSFKPHAFKSFSPSTMDINGQRASTHMPPARQRNNKMDDTSTMDASTEDLRLHLQHQSWQQRL